MAEKIFNTRIGLKIDTLANWQAEANQFVLKKGEPAFATVAATAGSGLKEPVIMVKIGDGSHTFNELTWDFYAKASDVHEWAKAAGLSIGKAAGNTGNVVSGIQWDATANDGKGGIVYTTTSVATSTSVEELTNNFNQLVEKVNGMYTNEQIDAAIKVVADDLAAHEEAFAKFQETNTEAIADAKKAGTDAGAAAETAQNRADEAYALAETKANADTTYTKDEVDGLVEPLATTEELNGVKATAEQGVADAAEAKGVADAAKARIDTFLDTEGVADVVDSLHDIKVWMEGEGVDATELTEAIAGEAKLREDGDKAINDVLATYGDIVTHNVDEFDAAGAADAAKEAAINDAAGKYETKGTAQGIVDALDLPNTYEEKGAAEAAKTDIINNELNPYKEATNGRLNILEAIDHSLYAKDADLHAIAKSGNVKDLVQTAGDIIVFDCGTASTNI